MSLKTGIVGMPNVGKSTLFNAITNSKIEAANYPFATIEPNVGIVEVPDERLKKITELIKPQKCIHTTFEFIDIAGLVKGAAQGAGLGNQFLANIREVDAIVQVVRCFVDDNIIHHEGSVDPIRDLETINLELAISDLEQAKKRFDRLRKKTKGATSDEKEEFETLTKVVEHLESDKQLRTLSLTNEELNSIKHLNFLTIKPIIYVANVSEDDLIDIDSNVLYTKLKTLVESQGEQLTYVCAKIEEELSDLETEEKLLFLNDLGIDQSGLDRLIKMSYDLLQLQTFFTAGEKEVRAWTFIKGMTAPQCAGVIHTDFESKFIRAEVMSYDDLMQFKSEKAVKEAGKLTAEGKDYVMKDADICHFLHNA